MSATIRPSSPPRLKAEVTDGGEGDDRTLSLYEGRMILYGIPNCDTVKKARTWLDAAGKAYTFHDYKKAGVPEERLRGWVERLGWATVLNRAGQTFRKLPDADRADLDAGKAIALMLAHPSAIRRPIAEDGDTLLAGFSVDRYAAAWEK